MKPILLCAIMFHCSFSQGQNFLYPSIKIDGKELNDFVPTGWKILDTARGDLNKDGTADAAIILQYNDSVSIKKSGNESVLTQPRILVVLFKAVDGNHFLLVAQSNSFILNHDNPTMDDPYEETRISNGTLKIKFRLFYNMGSWYVTNTSYTFRYQQEEFALIGADYLSFHRATSDFEEYSYNFLTKKRSLKTGNDKHGGTKTTWKSLNLATLKTLGTLKEPFTWEVERNIYL